MNPILLLPVPEWTVSCKVNCCRKSELEAVTQMKDEGGMV